MMSMLLFWILLIIAIILVVKNTLGSGAASGQSQDKTALDILNP